MSKQIKESKITKSIESSSTLKKKINATSSYKITKPESTVQNSVKKQSSVERKPISKPKITTQTELKPKTSVLRSERSLDNKQSSVLKKKSVPEQPRPIKPKLEATKIKPPARHLVGKTSSTKSNQVLDTYHNVTVSSPPPVRKAKEPDIQVKSSTTKPLTKSNKNKNSQPENETRIRTKTRTLRPEEVVVLRNKIQKDENIAEKNKILDASSNLIVKLPIQKSPVAFEINFNENKEPKMQDTNNKDDLMGENVIQDEYEDDFESYESDFESSSADAEDTSETESNRDDNIDEEEDTDDQENECENFRTDDESEETHPPITVIHLETKESENKLDSGNYDLHKENCKNSSSNNSAGNNSANTQLSSLDEMTTNSEKFDSGLEEIGNNHFNLDNTVTNTLKLQNPFSQRGIDLMKKIKLDSISYYLFEMRPVNYEYFMKIYGNIDCIQSATQTNENFSNSDAQTDEFQQRSMWTQHPPQFDLKFLQENGNFFGKNSNLNCCDEFQESDTNLNADPLMKSINDLNRFRKQIEANRNTRIGKTQAIDYDKLNDFLHRSTLTISGILNKKTNKNTAIIKTDLNFSLGYTKLNIEFLNALHIIKLFSNINCDLLFTIHECKDEIYRNDFLNLIIVWNVKQPDKPIRLLSTWSEVIRVDICLQSSDIIVGGLRDGSIALWDLRETHSYCSKLDGYLTHFAATYSITPSFNDVSEGIDFYDLGSLVDIKSFKSDTTAYNLNINKQIQFVSLHDTGILTIWTLVETGKQNLTLETISQQNTLKIEYHSPWARIKLTQSAICDLRQYLELKYLKVQSKYEKTKSYFENDIFNDETLRELQATNEDVKLDLKGLRFNCLDTSCDLIYIANNRNFIILCSKTLKSDRFRKIYIDESQFLFPTSLRLYPTNNEYLIVGLSNGSVKVINCNLNKTINQISDEVQDVPDASKTEKNDLEIGKSCAIQNIILNERKSFDDCDKNNLERPKTAFSDFYQNNEIDFENVIFDQQIIFNGSVLRKCLVENIEISLDGKRVYILSDGLIRVYDFQLKNEIDMKKNVKVNGMCMSKGNSKEQPFMTILNNDNEVQVHNIKI